MRYVFMSFKPLYARKIIDGVKDCEIRTYFGEIGSGDIVVVYASTPVKAVLGEFIVEDVAVGKFESVIEYLRMCCRMFDEDNWRFVNEHYVSSKRKLIVIKISSVERYRNPVTLETLKRLVPGFRPPISYTYIDPELYAAIRGLGMDTGRAKDIILARV